MANPPPETEDEAKNKCVFIPTVMDMHVERYGKAIRNPPKCAELSPGHLCESYLSGDGKSRFAIYCDGKGDCVRRYECPV